MPPRSAKKGSGSPVSVKKMPGRMAKAAPKPYAVVEEAVMVEEVSVSIVAEVKEGITVEKQEKPSESEPNDNGAADGGDHGYDDVWFEDGGLEDVSDDVCSHASVLNRECKRRHEQFHTMGYRDGITAGKEASVQEGFNAGFRQSVHDGYKWGLVRGISSGASNSPFGRLIEELGFNRVKLILHKVN